MARSDGEAGGQGLEMTLQPLAECAEMPALGVHPQEGLDHELRPRDGGRGERGGEDEAARAVHQVVAQQGGDGAEGSE